MKATSQFAINRRAFLGGSTGALGMMAMSRLLGGEAARPHHRARAKSVICLFQHGGPSQVDLFDPKPELNRRHGKKYDGDIEAHFEKQMGNCLASPYGFKRRGQAGIELSELLPHTAGIADDLTLVRSMTTGSVDHESALRLIHSGKFIAGWPAWGSWVIYGLGSANRNLPSYVVLADPGGLPVDGVRNWSSGWLPAVYQGVAFRAGKSPVPNLTTPKDITPGAHAGRLDFFAKTQSGASTPFPGQHRVGGAHCQLRDCCAYANRSAGRARPLARVRRHAQVLRPRPRHHARVRLALPDGPPVGRERRAVSCSFF